MSRTRRVAAVSVLPAVMMLAAAGVAATAPPERETAVARFSWQGAHAAPVALHVAPAVVEFGEVVAVVLDLPPGATLPDAGDLRVGVDWLVPAPDAALPDLKSLPAASGPRLVVPWRIYHLGSWRAAWQDAGPSAELTVRGRLPAPGEIMPVRDPRLPGGAPRWLAWLVVAVALALAAVWLRRRVRARTGYRVPADLPLPPPAWLLAATRLLALVEETGGGADGRRLLDRLAGILRAYLVDRFQLPATEMTSDEIAAAARAAGWPPGQVDGFCRLLASCDHLRYAPLAISASHGHAVLSAALDLIEEVRIQPRWTSVAPGPLAAAAAAWRELRARYPRRSDDGEVAAC